MLIFVDFLTLTITVSSTFVLFVTFELRFTVFYKKNMFELFIMQYI
jgi:hypothetical protein